MWIIWPFRKKNFGLSWTVCSDFRHFIDPRISSFVIEDERNLPHPKAAIFEALCVLLMTETTAGILESIDLCAFELPFFQADVGPVPLHPRGIRLTDADGSSRTGTAQVAGGASAPERERYDRFKLLRDAEWARMKATMAKLSSRAVA